MQPRMLVPKYAINQVVFLLKGKEPKEFVVRNIRINADGIFYTSQADTSHYTTEWHKEDFLTESKEEAKLGVLRNKIASAKDEIEIKQKNMIALNAVLRELELDLVLEEAAMKVRV